VYVADQNGSAVSGLTASNFSAKLYYGTGISKVNADSLTGSVVVQSISATGKSIAAAMSMDYSGSMFSGSSTNNKYDRITNMETGVKTFVNAMGATDIGEIIKFGSTVDFVFPFTSNKTRLLVAADSSSVSRGNTALYSSMYKGVQDAGAQSSTTYSRAVVAFTDGGENNSYPLTRAQLLALSRSYGIPIYTVGLLDAAYHTDPPRAGYGDELDLVQIADSTGGFYYYAPSAAQLAQIYSTISGNLSNALVVTINWPTTGLPASGTVVRAIVSVNYNGLSTQFVRQYNIP
jgi:hypothetical protein